MTSLELGIIHTLHVLIQSRNLDMDTLGKHHVKTKIRVMHL